MTPEEAIEALRDQPVVPVSRGGLDAIKALLAKCLGEGIPAGLRRPPEPGG